MGLSDLLSWLLANKEWLFSGVGVILVVKGFSLVRARRQAIDSPGNSQSQGGSRNIQVAGDATVIQEESPTGGDTPQLPKTEREEPKLEKAKEEPLSALERVILFVFAVIAQESGSADVSVSVKQIIDKVRDHHPHLVVSIKDALNKLALKKFLRHYVEGTFGGYAKHYYQLFPKGTEWVAENEGASAAEGTEQRRDAPNDARAEE